MNLFYKILPKQFRGCWLPLIFPFVKKCKFGKFRQFSSKINIFSRPLVFVISSVFCPKNEILCSLTIMIIIVKADLIGAGER